MTPDGGFLGRAVEAASLRAERSEAAVPARSLEERCASLDSPSSFPEALRRQAGEGVRIVAEIKPASPSAGGLSVGMTAAGGVEEQARAYTRGGAAAISVLTDPDFFSGHLADLERVSRVTRLPLLRKDFIVSAYQVLEARSHGASSLLLLAAALDDAKLHALLERSRGLGMEPLVEVHDEDEVGRALALGARAIAINNRDLRTLEMDMDTAPRLRELIPAGPVVVGASGYSLREQAAAAESAGLDALLVGEALMRSADPAAAIRLLRGTDDAAACPAGGAPCS